MILTDIGEIGVYHEGQEAILCPSLYAMSKLGDKFQIVDFFMNVMGGSLAHSLAVIQVCADRDMEYFFGRIDENLFYHEGIASAGEVIIVAQSLMKHGIIGDINRENKPTNKDYTPEFDARANVSLAVAHLGISEREAWGMTMTSIAGALQAKFPEPPRKHMTEEEEQDMLKWFEEQKAKK